MPGYSRLFHGVSETMGLLFFLIGVSSCRRAIFDPLDYASYLALIARIIRQGSHCQLVDKHAVSKPMLNMMVATPARDNRARRGMR